jgi:8-oxo-dGTP diphosphatase
MSEDKKDYPRPSLTADVVVIALGQERGLSVLFIQRARDPFQGAWALPGGFVEPGETVAQGAARELEEETALRDVRLLELGCFSRPGRDPRGWVVSVAHLGLVPRARLDQAHAGDDAAAAVWLDLVVEPGGGFRLEREGTLIHHGGAADHGPPAPSGLAFDHGDILAAAVERLRDRVGELAFELLPQPFQLPVARRAFEVILGEPVNPVTFERLLLDSMVHAVTVPTQPGADIDFVPVSNRRSPWLAGTPR